MGKITRHEDEPRTGTSLIAQGLGRDHRSILQIVNDYKDDFLSFDSSSDFVKRKLRSTGGRAATDLLLNFDQFLFLVSLLKNSKEVTKLKRKLVSTTTMAKAVVILREFDAEESLLRFVYVASDSLGRVKIGISNDPESRVKQLNIGNADKLTLVMTRKAALGGYQSEVLLHKKCDEFRIRSEWFSACALELVK